MTRNNLKETLAAAVIAALIGATTAQAGSYHVYSCRMPDGESAPADGWSGSTAAGGASDDYATNTCAGGGALISALGDKTTHIANVDRATWTFEAPSFVRVVGAAVWRSGYLHGRSGEKATYQFWLAAPAETDVFDECIFATECHVQGESGRPMAAINQLAVPAANLGQRLYLNVSCSGGISGAECGGSFTDPNGYAAVVYLYAADITLEQASGPTASGVSGELASAATVSGTSDVVFNATDPGSGVYEALVSVDGTLVQSTVLDENGGRCRNVGQTGDGRSAFLYVQPCKGSVSADVPVDTTRLADGSHHLVVSVIDAAGNSAPVLDRNIVVANGSATVGSQPPGNAGGSASSSVSTTTAGSGGTGAPNGTDASSQASLTVGWKGSRSLRLVTGYGQTETVTGRLTGPGGVSIGGALIDVQALPSYSGASTQVLASPRTAADGRFTMRIPAGASSRTLSFAYRSHLGDPLPAATRTLELTVRAAVQLSITPRIASIGRSIHFSGRLPGGPVPRTGKLLVLEARSAGGPWIKFDVVRTDRRGRYRASYRFRFPGPARYQFRVVAEPEGDYPYAAGASNTLAVREV